MNHILRQAENVLLLFSALCLLLAFNAVYIVNLTLAALAIHELGHTLGYLLLGRSVPSMRICKDGLRLGTKGIISYRHQLLVALCGPLANLVSCIFCLVLVRIFGDFSIAFLEIHLLLAISNLLPMKGRDGDVILRCALMTHGHEALYLQLSHILTLATEILFTLLALFAIRTYGEGYLPAFIFLLGTLSTLRQSINKQKTRF